MREIDCS